MVEAGGGIGRLVAAGQVLLEVAKTAQVLLDFPQDTPRQRPEGANEPAIVDSAAPVDHDLARPERQNWNGRPSVTGARSPRVSFIRLAAFMWS